MTETQQLILKTFDALRTELTDCAVAAVGLNPAQTIEQFPRADLEQMVGGTLVAVEEFYGGGERPFWDEYLETVVPGILAAGSEIAGLHFTVSAFFALSATELDRRLQGHALRDEARAEFVRFSSTWQQAIMDAASTVSR